MADPHRESPFLSQAQLEHQARRHARTNDAQTVTANDPLLADDDAQWVLFRAGGERFTVAVFELEEVAIMPTHGALLPHMHDSLLGLVNLHGELTLLADLARMMGLRGTKQRTDKQRMLLFRDATGQRTGFLIEQIDTTTTLDTTHFQKPPQKEGMDTRFIDTLGDVQGHTVARLNVTALLQSVAKRVSE
jgi:purine-binding chemotaxis protein CheW